MKIENVFEMQGRILAYCTGKEIKQGFSCKNIEIEGKRLTVLKTGVSMSFSGEMVALLEIQVNATEEVPLGEFIVVN